MSIELLHTFLFYNTLFDITICTILVHIGSTYIIHYKNYQTNRWTTQSSYSSSSTSLTAILSITVDRVCVCVWHAHSLSFFLITLFIKSVVFDNFHIKCWFSKYCNLWPTSPVYLQYCHIQFLNGFYYCHLPFCINVFYD